MNKILAYLLPFVFVGYASAASVENETQVRSFYELLNNPSSQVHTEKLRSALADDWKSIGDYSGRYKTADKFIKKVAGFGKLIPNLNWNIEEMIVSGDKVIVRGRVTGTPQGPLFGVDGKGKSFDIMTIDIHTIENNKITLSHHVENWSGALRQLSAK